MALHALLGFKIEMNCSPYSKRCVEVVINYLLLRDTDCWWLNI